MVVAAGTSARVKNETILVHCSHNVSRRGSGDVERALHGGENSVKVIIAGSRSIGSYEDVGRAIEKAPFEITEVVSGGAQGVDQLGKFWAYQAGIPSKQFNAHWSEHGKAAGPIRNREMAAYADALIAIWDGKSRGTKNMIEEMEKLNKPVFWVTLL